MSLPNVRVICLEDSPGREERLTEHLKEVGVQWTRFEGIDASRWGLTTTNTYEIDNPGSGYVVKQKHVGLHLSHYILWQIQRELGLEEMTVLEDDVLFTDDWKDGYKEARENLPDDWDFLMIGSAHCQYRHKKQIAGNVWNVMWPITTHAYIVRLKAIQTLLKTQRCAGSPIDLSLIFRSFPLLKVYTILPRLASQHNTPLDT